MRACLAEEFSAVYVLNLRGNARTSGELRRSEGDNAFGQGSRAPVAITILVRNPEAVHDGCRIRYRDIGDYLRREEKLAVLREAGSIVGIEDWQTIAPDRHHDWIGQRSEEFQKLYPVGSKAAKAGKVDEAVFRLYSRGLETARDAYVYNFSRDACAENARRMVEDYLGALRELDEFNNGSPTDEIIHEITDRHSSNVRWDQGLKDNLRRRKAVTYSPDNVWATQYRPFVKQHCSVENVFIHRKGQMDSIFPASDSENRVICVPGIGSTKPFSALVADTMPDLHFLAFGQCFPRYRYGSGRRCSVSFRGSNRAGSASTTSQTRPCAPSACATTTTRSPRTGFSITSTAFFTRLPTGHVSPTILPRNYRASLSRPIFTPLRGQGVHSRNFISAMRPARNTRLRLCLPTKENPGRSISGSASERCGLPTTKGRRLS